MIKVIASIYEIIEEIGAGGGGRVYLAFHRRLGKKVILKADKRKVTTREDLLRREVDILKNLSNPYIPQVYDFFIENGVVYTVMEFIEGESLDKSLKRKRTFSQPELIRWTKQLLNALDYLHQPIHGDPPRGYVHSDIKPANLMLRPNGDICLIDFNISLALGEKSVVGGSAGYASPEHYGLDFSSNSFTEDYDKTKTEKINDETLTLYSTKYEKKILPDVRSDIYSLGATLYHLLSGNRPAKNALDIVPLSKTEFSPAFVDIIMKCLNANPDLRYQTAKEMLDDIENIRKRDPRNRRLERSIFVSKVVLSLLLSVSLFLTFFGLRRMQIKDNWLNLAQISKEQNENGDKINALRTIMKTYEKKSFLSPEYLSKTEETLSEILGVYDLMDGFKVHASIKLPTEPLDLKISSNGKTCLCLTKNNLNILDLEKGKLVKKLPTISTGFADFEFIGDDLIVYASNQGVRTYSLSQQKNVWTGKKAVRIAVSKNGQFVAGIDDESSILRRYNAQTGEENGNIDLGNKKPNIKNDNQFINLKDNLFTLNEDGSKLALSSTQGNVIIYNFDEIENKIELFPEGSAFTHFEGDFHQKYLALSSTNSNVKDSAFMIIDTEKAEQTGGFQSEGYYMTSANENGIIVGVDNVLVKIDPETGEQTPLIETGLNVDRYNQDGQFTIISSKGVVKIFDENCEEITEFKKDINCNFIDIKNDTAVIGSSDSLDLWILKYHNDSQNHFATYDKNFTHDEARVNPIGNTMVYFTYNQFRICDFDGNTIQEISIPNSDEVYDQQFIRSEKDSYLEIKYNNGSVNKYSATNGELVEKRQEKAPDQSLDEVFQIDDYIVESPLHGALKVYRGKKRELVTTLKEDGFLTYVNKIGDNYVFQYVTTDGCKYGYMFDKKFEKIAYLPNLCDVVENGFLFDCGNGLIRKAKLYQIEELKELAKKEINEGEKV